MNQWLKHPVGNSRGLIFLALCALVAFCGVAGAVRVGPPLFRAALRSASLWQARTEWQELLRGAVPSDGSPLYNLTILGIDLDLPVLPDSGKSNLSRLPCLSATCLDQEHAPVIVAHRDLHFRGLSGVVAGDLVFLTRRNGTRQSYRVQQVQVVSPYAAELLATGADNGSLTLITCYPFRYVGPAPERFVVICESISFQNGENIPDIKPSTIISPLRGSITDCYVTIIISPFLGLLFNMSNLIEMHPPHSL